MFIYDLNHNRFTHTLDHYITDQLSHSYPTSANNSGNFPIPKVNLSISQHNFKYASIKTWNSVPMSVRTINNRHNFKKNLKQYLLRE